MRLRVIETTDRQWLGYEVELADPTSPPARIEVAPGIAFVPRKVDMVGPGLIRFSNPNYIVICKVVG